MKSDSFIQFVRECEESYKQFLNISYFPKFELVSKEITVEKSEKCGFDSWATAFYDIPTGKHRLKVWSGIHTFGEDGKYIIFHELTHILDDENIVQRDKIKHLANHGFTEYHASQIELMQMLGAKNVRQQITFSMNDAIRTVGGEKSVKEFVDMPRLLAIELISRKDFPADIETMKVTTGLIFNYYGRRSICKMFAHDYQDNEDNSIIAKLIYPQTVELLDKFMVSWFDDSKVTFINSLYQRMLPSLCVKYNLK